MSSAKNYEAINKITFAQRSNEYDMQGHALKAKQHLEDAMNELVLAEKAAEDEAKGKNPSKSKYQ